MKKLILSLILLFPFSSFSIDLEALEQKLMTEGVQGWVHGSEPSTQMFVFTFRNPDNFFDNIQMSLIPKSETEHNVLKGLKRHDKVLIKGVFLKNPSPQKHVLVSEIQVITQYNNGHATEDYDYEASVPQDLLGLSEAEFMVHAIAAEGRILVVEYKDVVIPVFVRNNTLTQNLYRNDIVQLKFRIFEEPGRPTHLMLNEKADNPVRVNQSAVTFQGKPADIEGRLVMFPKSPDIIFNVFAVEDTSYPGFKRQYTLLNMVNPDVFTQIRNKLQMAWDLNPLSVNGRNKLISQNVRVRAKGTFQIVDPNQANIQILLNSADDVTITQQ